MCGVIVICEGFNCIIPFPRNEILLCLIIGIFVFVCLKAFGMRVIVRSCLATRQLAKLLADLSIRLFWFFMLALSAV